MSPFTTEEIEALKIFIAGLFGALSLAYFRYPSSLPKAIFSVVLSTAVAWIFAPLLAELTGFYIVPVSYLTGLVGLVIAQRIIVFAESLDVGKWVKKP